MKFEPDRPDAPSITAYGPGWVAVDGQRHEHSLLIGSGGFMQAWAGAESFDALGPEHFAPLVERQPEVLLFGSGDQLRFAPPAWLAALTKARIGVECMDTPAACRTYNILVGEGRLVLAALLIEAPPH